MIAADKTTLVEPSLLGLVVLVVLFVAAVAVLLLTIGALVLVVRSLLAKGEK